VSWKFRRGGDEDVGSWAWYGKRRRKGQNGWKSSRRRTRWVLRVSKLRSARRASEGRALLFNKMSKMRDSDGEGVMRVVVASGKGGTGKTTIACNLAYIIDEEVSLLDCDVEEPNVHLFFQEREVIEEIPVKQKRPVVDESKCNGCGKCGEVCNFSAIVVVKGRVVTFPELCHGCGACALFCPQGAIWEKDEKIGTVEIAKEDGLEVITGRMVVGFSPAPEVIKATKKHGEAKIRIIDASPGVACPAVEAMRGADFAILVTEPTPFGAFDLELAIRVAKDLGIPCGVVINRAGEGDEIIEKLCAKEGVEIIGRIPNRREFAESYSQGKLLVREHPLLRENFEQIWKKVRECLNWS